MCEKLDVLEEEVKKITKALPRDRVKEIRADYNKIREKIYRVQAEIPGCEQDLQRKYACASIGLNEPERSYLRLLPSSE